MSCLSAEGQILPEHQALDKLYATEFHDHSFDKRELKYFMEGRSVVARYNPVSLTFGGLLLFYQALISPQLSTKCSFQHSCSEFSRMSIGQYGLIKGVALSADRLMRCNGLAAKDISLQDLDFEKMKIRDHPDRYTLRH